MRVSRELTRWPPFEGTGCSLTDHSSLQRILAVRDIDLDVAGGELVALLGPSGCGKSTLLRIVSGFIRQSQGRVLFDGEPVDHLPPSRRGVGIVFRTTRCFRT